MPRLAKTRVVSPARSAGSADPINSVDSLELAVVAYENASALMANVTTKTKAKRAHRSFRMVARTLLEAHRWAKAHNMTPFALALRNAFLLLIERGLALGLTKVEVA